MELMASTLFPSLVWTGVFDDREAMNRHLEAARRALGRGLAALIPSAASPSEAPSPAGLRDLAVERIDEAHDNLSVTSSSSCVTSLKMGS